MLGHRKPSEIVTDDGSKVTNQRTMEIYSGNAFSILIEDDTNNTFKVAIRDKSSNLSDKHFSYHYPTEFVKVLPIMVCEIRL